MNKRNVSLVKIMMTGLIALVISINFCLGQTKNQQLDRLLELYQEYGKFNGSVLVADQGKVVYKKGFGMANMEWDIPNEPNTKHRLGSITKQFTAMLILQLAAENKLDLHAPITKYLVDYPKENGGKITSHHLLSHTSGIPNYTSFPGFFAEESRNPYTPDQFVEKFSDKDLEFTPGEKFNYSNSGYFLLGVIAEKLTGKTYEELLEEKIFTPLAMNDSGYDNHDEILKNRATGYEKVGRDFINSHYLDMSIPYAAGSLYSTVEDLYLWDQALYTTNLLSQKYMDMYFEPHIPAFGNHYAYGWIVGTDIIGNTKESIDVISHGGGINGFNTIISRSISNKSLIVLLNNTGGAPLNQITRAINGIMQGKTFDLPKKSLAYDLLAVIQNKGIEAGVAHFKTTKDSDGFDLSENEMNQIGYQLMGNGKVEEAAQVFKLNIDAFPKSSNAYDSYGEALLALGDKTQGIENYKKSIKLNPNNQGGIKVLKENGVDVDALIVKVPVEHLKLLAGEYIAIDQPKEMSRIWKIVIEEEEGILYGNDNGYRYTLSPVGQDEFINPDDGASVEFNTKDKNAISFEIFGKYNFKKVN